MEVNTKNLVGLAGLLTEETIMTNECLEVGLLVECQRRFSNPEYECRLRDRCVLVAN